MKRGGALRRPGGQRRERSRILIVTEGEETEIQYLQGIAQHLRATGAQVASMYTKGIGRDPVRVVKAGLELAQRSEDGFDGIWAIVDVDEHATLEAAVQLARRKGTSIVVSNPCFEVWLLWHYSDCTAYVSHSDLRARLAQHGLSGKHLPARFPFASFGDAIRRANGQPAGAAGPNPSSAMGHLVAALQGA